MAAEPDADGTLPVAMVNLIAGRRVVPELLNRRFTPEAVAAALRPLLEDGPERAAQIAGLAEVRRSLDRPASAAEDAPFRVVGTQRVAEVVVELLNAGATAHVPIAETARLTSVSGKIPAIRTCAYALYPAGSLLELCFALPGRLPRWCLLLSASRLFTCPPWPHRRGCRCRSRGT